MAKFILESTKSQLITDLINKGITDQLVIQAISRVPRERFVHPAFVKNSYHDISLPIGCEQTISQPFTVAYMSQLLELQPNMNVLEIGTGSGYQAAVLAEIGVRVTSVERQKDLSESSAKLLQELGYNVTVVFGDGTNGCQSNAPYDRIIITAGAPDIPKTLLYQLSIHGKMVLPVGNEKQQQMHIITRNEKDDFDVFVSKENFSFVPLIGEHGWNK